MLHADACLDGRCTLAGSPMTGQVLKAASCTINAVFVTCKSLSFANSVTNCDLACGRPSSTSFSKSWLLSHTRYHACSASCLAIVCLMFCHCTGDNSAPLVDTASLPNMHPQAAHACMHKEDLSVPCLYQEWHIVDTMQRLCAHTHTHTHTQTHTQSPQHESSHLRLRGLLSIIAIMHGLHIR